MKRFLTQMFSSVEMSNVFSPVLQVLTGIWVRRSLNPWLVQVRTKFIDEVHFLPKYTPMRALKLSLSLFACNVRRATYADKHPLICINKEYNLLQAYIFFWKISYELVVHMLNKALEPKYTPVTLWSEIRIKNRLVTGQLYLHFQKTWIILSNILCPKILYLVYYENLLM